MYGERNLMNITGELIPGIPEGWELVAFSKIVEGTWYLRQDGKVAQWKDPYPSTGLRPILAPVNATTDSQSDLPGKNRAGNAMLLFLAGENDRPSSRIVRSLSELRDSIRDEIAGDKIEEIDAYVALISTHDFSDNCTCWKPLGIGYVEFTDVHVDRLATSKTGSRT